MLIYYIISYSDIEEKLRVYEEKLRQRVIRSAYN